MNRDIDKQHRKDSSPTHNIRRAPMLILHKYVLSTTKYRLISLLIGHMNPSSLSTDYVIVDLSLQIHLPDKHEGRFTHGSKSHSC